MGYWTGAMRTSENSPSRTFVNTGKKRGRTLLLRSITVVVRHSHPVQAIVYVVVRRVVLGVLDALNEVVSQSLDHRLRFGSCHVLLSDVEVYAALCGIRDCCVARR